nr:hypothetical protein [uncultured Bacteroides sp.]
MSESTNNGQIGDTYNYYQQTYPDSCAIMSQKFIMDEFGVTDANGTPYSEDDLVQYASSHGLYNGGTAFNDVGKIMTDAGIPCTQSVGNSVFDLTSQLSQGHKIIVGVDSNELWNGNLLDWFKDFFCGDTPDHALVVCGLDTSDPQNVKVVVDDPGSGDHHKAYPLDQFMDAWQDSHCFMCSTDVAAPQVAHGMQNFNYNTGHIDNVAGVDYDKFMQFCNIDQNLPDMHNWDNSIVPHPVESLYDAFLDVSQNPSVDIYDALGQNHFYDHVDSNLLTTILHNDALQGYNSLIETGNLNTNNLMFSDIGDTFALQQYFDQQSVHYDSVGNTDAADYFHHQAELINTCQTYNIDVNPADLYNFI